MDTILSESLSPEEMNALMGTRRSLPASSRPPPVWPEIEKLEPARLGAFLAEEHPQTAALVLSKLAPQAAANALLTLEKPLRSEIVKRMMSIATIPEAATAIVENQLRARAARRQLGQGHVRRPDAGRQPAQRARQGRSSTR